MARPLLVVALAFALTNSACGDPSAESTPDADEQFDIRPLGDTDTDGSATEDPGAIDVIADVEDVDEDEASADTGECRSLGCPCERDADCDADFCVRHPEGGMVCSERCGESCSIEGYECRTLRDGADLVRYCVPLGDPYCQPCAIDADCLATENLCMTLADGEFCATGCGDGAACPDAASCVTVVVGDVRVPVCVPDSNQCADCLDPDGDGRGTGPGCLGFDCDEGDTAVFEDAPEACDGVDNDCDEAIDEGFDGLGETCGVCDSGRLACHELALACVGDLGDGALNECGGCGDLGGAVGDACGVCGHGAFACGGPHSLTCEGDRANACGGCDELRNAPGGACDAGCGSDTWTCSLSGETTICLGEGTNSCGGCATLPAFVGDPCTGDCGDGTWACVDGAPDELQCDDGIDENACGGCASLGATPGDDCGACAAVWTCDDDGDVACIGDPTDSDGDTVCDADDACPGFDDRDDADADGIPDACDGPPPECETREGCPDDIVGDWGACGDFSSPCDETGTRERSVTRFACDDGACVFTSSTEPEACDRNTDGDACGAETTYTEWSGCGGFDGTCDETGIQRRTRTDFACADASCTGTDTGESQACARDTDGTTCDTTAHGDWSACAGYSSTCDETGTHSRDVTTYSCNAGSCDASPSSEEEACARDTDGTTCDTTTYGTWGACGGYSSTCDETGTRSRDVTTYSCNTGACAALPSSEDEACARDTDGTICDTTTYGDWSACGGYSSTCDETGTRSRDVTSYSCNTGSCDATPSSEGEGCVRDTDGDTCNVTSYGPWGTCGGFESTCDETGSHSRDRTDWNCASGSCSDTASSERDSCTRDTDGALCVDWAGCRITSCSRGVCPVGSSCSFPGRCCEPGICIDPDQFCP